MRSANEALPLSDFQLVVDPFVLRIPRPSVAILRRHPHVVRAGHIFEILLAPWICFANWHRIALVGSQESGLHPVAQINTIVSPILTGGGLNGRRRTIGTAAVRSGRLRPLIRYAGAWWRQPEIDVKLRVLIRRMSVDNPLAFPTGLQRTAATKKTCHRDRGIVEPMGYRVGTPVDHYV
jgi:hypothetical protein